jgi:hypothetical protein
MQGELDHYLESLRAFKRMHGNCYVLSNDGDHCELRKWLHRQYAMRKVGRLDARTIACLEELGVDWEAFGAQWEKWERRYRELIDFRKENGHCDVSQLQRGLGPWLSAQRVMYRNGTLPQGRFQLLDELGVDWRPQQRLKQRWATHLAELEAFRERHGHCNVSRRTHPKLGIWVSAQRTARRKGLLCAERVAKLNAIGFQWSARRRSRA